MRGALAIILWFFAPTLALVAIVALLDGDVATAALCGLAAYGLMLGIGKLTDRSPA